MLIRQILILELLLLLGATGGVTWWWAVGNVGEDAANWLPGILLGTLVFAMALIVMAIRWMVRLQRQIGALCMSARCEGKKGQASDPSETTPLLEEIGELGRAIDQSRNRWSFRCETIERVRRDLQCMLETIPEAVVAIDENQRVLFANPTTYRLFELPPQDISGQKLWAIVRQPAISEAVERALATHGPTSTEFEIRNPSRVISFRARGLALESGRGLIIVLHDATEIRRLERMREDFFASVSHELKTPLAAIKAYTETLIEDAAGDPDLCLRFLQRIDEQADRLHTLVIDMLTLARVESEDHGFDIKPIDAHASILGVVEEFRQEAEVKGIGVEIRLDSAPAWVMADPEGLGVIVRNLVDNAIKYTPLGGTVSVRSYRQADHLAIEINDTGVGIPSSDLSRIFERFYRVDKARSRELGGTGLGLSIVKHLTQRFGGTITVASRLHEGSIFTVLLPRIPRPLLGDEYGAALEEELTA